MKISKVIRPFVLASVSYMIGLGFLPSALACRCAQPVGSPEEVARREVEVADAVFLGTVEEFKVIKAFESVVAGRPPIGSNHPGRIATFRVWTVWKGPQHPHMKVATAFGGGDCGFDFMVGRDYQVYAYGQGEARSTHICTPTQAIHGFVYFPGPGSPVDLQPRAPLGDIVATLATTKPIKTVKAEVTSIEAGYAAIQ